MVTPANLVASTERSHPEGQGNNNHHQLKAVAVSSHERLEKMHKNRVLLENLLESTASSRLPASSGSRSLPGDVVNLQEDQARLRRGSRRPVQRSFSGDERYPMEDSQRTDILKNRRGVRRDYSMDRGVEDELKKQAASDVQKQDDPHNPLAALQRQGRRTKSAVEPCHRRFLGVEPKNSSDGIMKKSTSSGRFDLNFLHRPKPS
jgi:hypothetical protein